jgi:hypothetical protein
MINVNISNIIGIRWPRPYGKSDYFLIVEVLLFLVGQSQPVQTCGDNER